MDKKEFKKFLRECIEEVLVENISDNDPLYVEYHSQRQGEEPFMLNGTKYEYVNAKYPDGKIDVGVYSFAEDLVYSYNVFRSRHNLSEKEETFYQDASDYEDMAAEVGRDIEAVEKAGLKAQYDSLMNGIFKLPIAEFDKRSEQLRLLVQKAYEIVGGSIKENEFDDENLPKHNAKISNSEKQEADVIAKKIWGDTLKSINFHSTSLNGRSKFFKVNIDSTYFRWLNKNEQGQWFYTDDEGIRSKWLPFDDKDKVNEMSTTAGVQGFLSKNWVDTDPKRKRMKSIAAKSVGGKVT